MEAKIIRVPTKNWAPNGPMDYARSARRYKFGPTDHAPVFYSHEKGAVVVREAGGTHEPGDPASAGPKMTGEAIVTATDIQNDSQYVCPVTIGTHNDPNAKDVTLRLDFDTGSADLWVWSSLYRQSHAASAQHIIYDPSQSDTAEKVEGLVWNISYLDKSSASGVVFRDDVKIGDIVVRKQTVEVATDLNKGFLTDPANDGLLGLGFSSLNSVTLDDTNRSPNPQKTPVANMIEQGLLKKPIFTAKLDKGDSHGFYTFGYIDETVTNNPMLYTPVITSHGVWEFLSETINIGSETHNRPGNTAIADTGTSLILLHDDIVRKIYALVPGAILSPEDKGYIFPNSSISQLPKLTFAVGENQFSIPGKDLAWSDANRPGYTFGGVQSRGGSELDILGDVFFNRVYAVFDQSETPRIGFAQLG